MVKFSQLIPDIIMFEVMLLFVHIKSIYFKHVKASFIPSSIDQVAGILSTAKLFWLYFPGQCTAKGLI